MQENLRLVIWTIVAIIGVWFVAMAINRNIFLHSDIDRTFYGTIAMNKTDIGDQCGQEYLNSFELVEYKLNLSNQIVYLCPQGLWPIQPTVTAVTIPDSFRALLAPRLRARINVLYPPQARAIPGNPAGGPAAPATSQPPPVIANPFSPAVQQSNTTTSQQQTEQPVPQQAPQQTAPMQTMPPTVQPGAQNPQQGAQTTPNANPFIQHPPVAQPPSQQTAPTPAQ